MHGSTRVGLSLVPSISMITSGANRRNLAHRGGERIRRVAGVPIPQ